MNTNNPKLKLGFIGAGFIGQIAHIDNFARLNSCELTAIADLRPKLRQAVADKYQIKQQYSNHQELLKSSDVDAVVVVTPRHLTAGIVFDCLNAKKHVLSEKPMAGTYEQGLLLVDAAKANHVNYSVGYMKRYDAGVVKGKLILSNLLKTKELGKLLHIKASCYMGDSYCKAGGHVMTDEKLDVNIQWENMAPGWLSDVDKPYFARYVNVYSHMTNLLSFLLEKSPKVEYFNFINRLAHTCILNYDDFLVTLDTGEVSNRDWEEELDIIFEHGKLSIKLPPALLRNVPASVTLYKAGDIQEIIQPKIDWSWAFLNQAESFVKNIQSGKRAVIDAQYALNDLKLIEDIWGTKC